MKIYLSGPIRGVADYKDRFRKAAAAVEDLGHLAMDPAASPFDGGSLREVMRWDLILLTACDAILMLPGWEQSGGANVERYLAEYLGMRVYYKPEDIPENDGEAEI